MSPGLGATVATHTAAAAAGLPAAESLGGATPHRDKDARQKQWLCLEASAPPLELVVLQDLA